MKGSKLKKWREKWGLTQKRLAALLAVARPTISVWERGKRRIPPRSEMAIMYLIETVEKKEFLQQLVLDWDSRIEDALNAPQLQKMEQLSARKIPSLKNVDRILRQLERILRRVHS
jgi:transcriptional regulator with XRE-family HTH domain